MTNGQEAIPETWRRERLGDISENVFSGGTPSRSNDSYWGGEHYWLSSSELDKGEIYETSETITQEGLDESSTSTFPENSLLIAMYGKTRGKSAINRVEMTGNQAICCLDLKNDFSTEYAWYQVIKNRPRLISLGGGAGQQNIRQSIIRNLKIPIAPLDEQRRIASVLYSMDEQIRTLTDRHDSLTQLKHGLMQDLLTGETRVTPEINVKEEVSSQRKSEINEERILSSNKKTSTICGKEFIYPEEWDVSKLGTICRKVKRGASPRPIGDNKWFGGDVGWVRIRDITSENKYLTDTEEYLSEDGVNNSVPIHPGEVLMSIAGTVAEPSIAKMEACIHDGLVCFKKLDKNVCSEYLYYFIEGFRKYIESIGMTGTQTNLNSQVVSEIRFINPPLWEQERIASVLYTVDEMIARTSDLIDEYERLKRGLMQDLLSGDVRTPEDLSVLDEIKLDADSTGADGSSVMQSTLDV